jgi:hypothetical protein
MRALIVEAVIFASLALVTASLAIVAAKLPLDVPENVPD